MNPNRPDGVGSSRRKLIYCLAQVDRIGQLAGEVFFLRNVFRPEDCDLTVVCYPPEYKPRTNRSAYDIVMRGIEVIHSVDDRIIWLAHRNKNAHAGALAPSEGGDVFLYHPSRLNYLFYRDVRDREIAHPFRLSPEEGARGERLRAEFGIPSSGKIVTLHVREGGYLSDMTYHSFRDCAIDNYRPAIECLLRQGYYVIRLGDPSMRSLSGLSGEYIELWSHPAYCQFCDPYFVSASSFFIGTCSGPQGLAKGFGVPILMTNVPIQTPVWGEESDLAIFKKYWSHELNRLLSYEEALSSPAADCYHSHAFSQLGLELLENSPGEILGAALDMLERLEAGAPQPEALAIDEQVQAIRKRVHEARCLRDGELEYPFLPAHLFNLPVSARFVRANPGFLSREPVSVG